MITFLWPSEWLTQTQSWQITNYDGFIYRKDTLMLRNETSEHMKSYSCRMMQMWVIRHFLPPSVIWEWLYIYLFLTIEICNQFQHPELWIFKDKKTWNNPMEHCCIRVINHEAVVNGNILILARYLFPMQDFFSDADCLRSSNAWVLYV